MSFDWNLDNIKHLNQEFKDMNARLVASHVEPDGKRRRSSHEVYE